jgi:hypothetical protein
LPLRSTLTGYWWPLISATSLEVNCSHLCSIWNGLGSVFLVEKNSFYM